MGFLSVCCSLLTINNIQDVGLAVNDFFQESFWISERSFFGGERSINFLGKKFLQLASRCDKISARLLTSVNYIVPKREGHRLVSLLCSLALDRCDYLSVEVCIVDTVDLADGSKIKRCGLARASVVKLPNDKLIIGVVNFHSFVGDANAHCGPSARGPSAV